MVRKARIISLRLALFFYSILCLPTFKFYLTELIKLTRLTELSNVSSAPGLSSETVFNFDRERTEDLDHLECQVHVEQK